MYYSDIMKNVEMNIEKMQEAYAKKLKICGHPLRLKILSVIKEETPCVRELWEYLEEVQPVISQHLAILKDSGIVSSEVDGNKRMYYITDPFVDEMISLVKAYAFSKK